MGLNVCPFGCELGFVDPLQQRYHVAFDCYSPPAVPSPDLYEKGQPVCSQSNCRQRYAIETQMHQHYMEKHGSKGYKEDPNVSNQDYICFKGFSGSYNLYMHMIAKSGVGSHVNNIFTDFNVSVSPCAELCNS